MYAHPPRLRKDADRAARLLAPLLGRPESELKALLSSDEPFVWLKRRLDPTTSRAIAKLDPKLVFKGGPIDFQPEPKRFYPQGELGVHVVGFADLDQKGLDGIERTFDDALQGDSTKFLAARDARGTMLLQPLRPPAKRSHDVVLTIDLVLQHVVERELDRAMEETGAKAATAILLDPKSGEILALANRPTVDPRAYGKAPAEARRNRAVQDVLEPGSTFKVISAAAAIERGAVTAEQRFQCASFTVAGKSYTDVHRYGVLVGARDSRALFERRHGAGRAIHSEGGPSGDDRALRLRPEDGGGAARRAQREHHLDREDVRNVAGRDVDRIRSRGDAASARPSLRRAGERRHARSRRASSSERGTRTAASSLEKRRRHAASSPPGRRRP